MSRPQGGGDEAEAPRPPRQGVQQRARQDELLPLDEALGVEHAHGLVGEPRLDGRARPQVGAAELVAVEVDDVVVFVEERDDEAAPEVLVPALAEDAEPTKLAPDLLPSLPVPLLEPVAERPVAEAQLEVGDHLGVTDATVSQPLHRLGGADQGSVVESEHLAAHGGVGLVGADEVGELRGGRGLHVLDGARGLEVGPEQGLGVARADALGAGHPVHHATVPAAHGAGPGVRLGVDGEGVGIVLAERAAAHELRAPLGELDALGFDEPFQGEAGLDVHGGPTGRPVVGHPLYYERAGELEPRPEGVAGSGSRFSCRVGVADQQGPGGGRGFLSGSGGRGRNFEAARRNFEAKTKLALHQAGSGPTVEPAHLDGEGRDGRPELRLLRRTRSSTVQLREPGRSTGMARFC